jgi:hypothetical protein
MSARRRGALAIALALLAVTAPSTAAACCKPSDLVCVMRLSQDRPRRARPPVWNPTPPVTLGGMATAVADWVKAMHPGAGGGAGRPPRDAPTPHRR